MHVLFRKNTFIVVHVIVHVLIRMHKIKLCSLYFEINLNSKSDCLSKRSLAEINFRNIFSFLPDLVLTTLLQAYYNLMFVGIILSESITT